MRPSATTILLVWLFLGSFFCLFFREPIFLGKNFYEWDHGAFYVPGLVVNARLRAAGEFPLWNRHVLAGFPCQAESELGGLYPPGLLFNVVSDVGAAYTLYTFFHQVLALLGMLLLARVAGLSICAQATAAVVFVFGGSFVGINAAGSHLWTFAWAPTILALHLHALCRQSYSAAALAGIVLSCQMLGMHPQATAWTLLLMFFVLCGVLVQCHGADAWRQRFVAITASLLVGLVALGLSAPHIGYCFELLQHSERGGGLTYAQQVASSLTPLQLVGLVAPEFFKGQQSCIYFGILGLPLLILASRASGPMAGLFRFMFVASLILALGQFGNLFYLLALVFAVAGWTAFSSTKPWFLLVLLASGCVLSFVIALYHSLTIYHLLHWLPGFRQVIYRPERFTVVASLPGAMLAGFGLDRLRAGDFTFVRVRRGLILAGAAVLILAEAPIAMLAPVNAIDDYFRGLAIPFILGSCCALLWLVSCNPNRIPLLAQIAPVLLALDLLLYFGDVHLYAPRDYYSSIPPAVSVVRKDKELCRIYSTQLGSKHPLPSRLPMHTSATYGSDALNSALAVAYSDLIWFFGNKELLSVFSDPALSAQTAALDLRLYGLYNVKYLLTDQSLPGLQPVDPLEDGEWRLYQNPWFQPRLTFRSNITVVDSVFEAKEILQSKRFDLSTDVIVDEAPRFVDGHRGHAPPKETRISVEDYRDQQVTLDVDVTKAGILVLADLFYPGWYATSNGRKIDILRANGVSRGLALAPGRHHIVFYYCPRSFYNWLWLSVLTGCLLVACYIWVLVNTWRKAAGSRALSINNS